MAYNLDYDLVQNTLFVSYPGEQLKTEADVDEFYQRLYDKLAPIGHKVYFVADMNDFAVDPTLANYYSEGLKKLMEKYVIAIFRYNVKPGLHGLAIRLASLQSGLPANIYSDREAALAARDEIRKQSGER